MPKVLITDSKDFEMSSEIPGLFKDSGATVEVYCYKDSWLLKNSSWHKWHEARVGEEAYFQRLLELTNAHNYDWVVYVEDFTTRIVRKYAPDKFFDKFAPISKVENRELLGSKAAFSLLCNKYGILTPKFEIYNTGKDIKELASTVGYPLLLKVDESGAGAGVYMCGSDEELVKNFALIKEEDRKNLVLQKFIKGQEVAVEALYKNGELLAYVYSKVLGNTNGNFSVSSVREYVASDSIGAELEHIGRSFGINSYCNFSFIRSEEDRRHYFIEADVRSNAWFPLAHIAGVNFTIASKGFLLNHKTNIQQLPGPIIIRHFSRNIYSAIKSGDVAELWKWVLNIGNRWNFLPKDPKVLWAIVSLKSKNFSKKLLRFT